MEREVAKDQRRGAGRTVTKSILRSTDYEDEIAPVPTPIATNVGPYKWGGKTWTLMQFTTPGGTFRFVMSPGDAMQFSKDIKAVARGVVDGDREDREAAETASGLVIASTLPDEQGGR